MTSPSLSKERGAWTSCPDMRNGKTKRLTTLAVSVAVAMMLSFIESRIPPLVAVPGVKMGLANIAVIFTLFKLGPWQAVAVSLVRVLLSAMLFGSPVSMLYSIAGAVLSLTVMILLSRVKIFGTVGVSVAGGVMHNVGQITVASIIMETAVIVLYLPALIISGTLAGIAIGVAGALLVKKVNIK